MCCGYGRAAAPGDRKSTRLNSSHVEISYAVFCLKKKSGDPALGEPLPRQSSREQHHRPAQVGHVQADDQAWLAICLPPARERHQEPRERLRGTQQRERSHQPEHGPALCLADDRPPVRGRHHSPSLPYGAVCVVVRSLTDTGSHRLEQIPRVAYMPETTLAARIVPARTTWEAERAAGRHEQRSSRWPRVGSFGRRSPPPSPACTARSSSWT